MKYEYTPNPELTALSKRYRMIERTQLIERGLSPELVEIYLDKRAEVVSEAFFKIIMEEGDGSGALLWLLDKPTIANQNEHITQPIGGDDDDAA